MRNEATRKLLEPLQNVSEIERVGWPKARTFSADSKTILVSPYTSSAETGNWNIPITKNEASYELQTQLTFSHHWNGYPALRDDEFFHPLGQSSRYFKWAAAESKHQRKEITTSSNETESETHTITDEKDGKTAAALAAASWHEMELDKSEFFMLLDLESK